eukprot:9458684-Ditylum_brightwellii.AAC.2
MPALAPSPRNLQCTTSCLLQHGSRPSNMILTLIIATKHMCNWTTFLSIHQQERRSLPANRGSNSSGVTTFWCTSPSELPPSSPQKAHA